MVILYSTNCPKCIVLEKKLKEKGVGFTIENDINKIVELGYSCAPILQVDDKYMEFGEAVNWVNNR